MAKTIPDESPHTTGPSPGRHTTDASEAEEIATPRLKTVNPVQGAVRYSDVTEAD